MPIAVLISKRLLRPYGDPKFRQLEPDRPLVKAAQGVEADRVAGLSAARGALTFRLPIEDDRDW
jgi:hypothetical protein